MQHAAIVNDKQLARRQRELERIVAQPDGVETCPQSIGPIQLHGLACLIHLGVFDSHADLDCAFGGSQRFPVVCGRLHLRESAHRIVVIRGAGAIRLAIGFELEQDAMVEISSSTSKMICSNATVKVLRLRVL